MRTSPLSRGSTPKIPRAILVRPDPSFAYGSAVDGLALSKDGQKLFVAMGGNNAIAVVELPNNQHTNSLLQGFLPTDWYPGAVLAATNFIYVANVKGLGTRFGPVATKSWQIEAPLGTANKIPIPTADSLSKYTAQVFEDGRIPQIKQTQQPAHIGQVPVPVPARVGEPSVFQHVLYILKENKTYDQVFGDIAQGNGNPGLCIYPQFVTPNHHALARDFVVFSEVGSKDAQHIIPPYRWVEMVEADLAAGSWRVICEARESGTVGIYHSNGEVKAGLIEEIVARVDVSRLLFEAPQKAQQAWLVQKFGPNVNLGNIPSSDVIALETVRVGLRADTMADLFDVASWNARRADPAATPLTGANAHRRSR